MLPPAVAPFTRGTVSASRSPVATSWTLALPSSLPSFDSEAAT
jgi:hypothetical protein